MVPRHAAANLSLTLIAALLLALPGGCASGDGPPASDHEFSKRFNQLSQGAPAAEVVARLGEPKSRQTGVVGIQPTGPQRPKALPAGSRYEHWLYRRDDTEYHVFLRPAGEDLRGWEVYDHSANPAGAPIDASRP